jgi:hypothetical protein
MIRLRPLLLLLFVLILWPAGAFSKPGFFSVTQKEGRWWLVDPQGQPFFASAINSVGIGPDLAHFDAAKPSYCGLRYYPDQKAWATATVGRLQSWGFNTLGGYCDLTLYAEAQMPYTIPLAWGSTLSVPWMDPGSAESKAKLRELSELIKRYKGDKNLIGYFIDNELGWWDESMFTYWFTRPSAERPKAAMLKLLKAEYNGDLSRLTQDLDLSPLPVRWKDLAGKFERATLKAGARPRSVERFVAWYADEYYSALAAAVRRVDPDHLLLGDRYLSYYSPAVASAAGKHMDVVSANFNTYAENGWVSPAFFDGLYAAAGKPIMITEFYFSAMENNSGDPNLHGPFIKVQTQKERAKGAAAMAKTFASLPYVVGHHWFQFEDEPKTGRDDGEDFNFGVVDIFDKPYPLLTAALTAANQAAPKDHAAARGFVVRTPGQLPRASKLKNDGYLGDWNLAAAWLGQATPTIRAYSPGDFYAAWTPEGVWLGLAFMDFDTSPATPGVPRFEIRLTRQGETLPFKVSGYQDSKPALPRLIGNGPRFPALNLEGPVPLKASRACNEKVSITQLTEIFLSAKDLGGELKEGETITLDLSLVLKGADRQWNWKGPLALGPAWGEN